MKYAIEIQWEILIDFGAGSIPHKLAHGKNLQRMDSHFNNLNRVAPPQNADEQAVLTFKVINVKSIL